MQVNLLLIGAGRSGTTSLYKYLSDHSEINFSIHKEIAFFTIMENYKKGEEYLHSFFKDNPSKFNAFCDTYLLSDSLAPEKIKAYNQNMKFIVILREPVERAFSSYRYAINNGYLNTDTSFEECFRSEKPSDKTHNVVEKNNLLHFYNGLYHKHLTNWLQYFPKDHFLILSFNDLKNNPDGLLQQISSFLDIQPFPANIHYHENASAAGKSKTVQQFLVNRNNRLRRILRNLIPGFIRKKVLHSQLINWLKKLNKSDKMDQTNDFKYIPEMKKYFEDDLKSLKSDFKITF